MKQINRRTFCRTGISTAIGLGIPGALTSCTEELPPSLPPSDEITARVAAIKGNDLKQMTLDALEAIGGMPSIVHEGETVFIKPNLVTIPWAQSINCFQNGECTKPEITMTVAEECLKAGARNVVIGEGSHQPSFQWEYALTLDGSTNMVLMAEELDGKYGGDISLACLETDSPSWPTIPSDSSLEEIAISSLAAEADRVISIPVAKTHSWAQLTLGTKNFIGITPLSQYAQKVNDTTWNRVLFDHSTARSISQIFLDITQSLQPDLTVVDFSIGLEGNGPTLEYGGNTVDMKDHIGSWAVLASTDIMAADATAARIMDHEVDYIQQLIMGYKMGLGEIREASIEVVGENIENLKSDWKPAQ